MSSKQTLENRITFEKLYLKTQWSDVNFLFKSDEGEKESVLAHKLLLAAQSDVFDAISFGELNEKCGINVTDASIDAFKEFLKFFYLDRVKLMAENVAKVMSLGHKYNVTNYTDKFVDFLGFNQMS